MRRFASFIVFSLVVTGPASSVTAQEPGVYTVVSELRRQSREDALTIKDVYRRLMHSAAFEDLSHLQRALDSGELVPLSAVELPGVQPRLGGQSPIAEKDLENQHLYLALRPAAMGMLIDIARRAPQHPLEVTSLVRTTEYQRRLMRGNGNANTDVPTHTMGYAVDIGLKYTSSATANALRRVLDEMRDAGDIYYIAEANQLTFHIVPVPSRIEHFEALYQQAAAEANQPEPASAAPAPPPQEASRFAGVWNWIAGLFD